jgi:hypothetical protein
VPNVVGVGGVVVAVLVGVEDVREGGEGGVGGGRGHRCLPAGLVPQDGQVEGGEQAGLEGGGQAREDVAEVGESVE